MRDEDIRACLRVLDELTSTAAEDDDPDLERVRAAAVALVKRTRERDRLRRRREQAAADAAVLAATATGAADRKDGARAHLDRPALPDRLDAPDHPGIADHPGIPDHTGIPKHTGLPDRPGPPDRLAHLPAQPHPPAQPRTPLNGLHTCYVCKLHFTEADAFYHRLCPPCAAEHHKHRHARADLTGRRAIVTGGRVKAGFELVLKLLRDGAEVTALTRFPADARRRFAAVPDHAAWADRLTVTGLDLRDVPAVVRWCDGLVAAGQPLDILINMAAQTLRHPPESYAALLAGEDRPALTGGPALGVLGTAVDGPGVALEAPGTAVDALRDAVDVAGLLPDPADHNSWTRLVHEVDPVELLEVQLINVTAPFLLLGRLRPLLERSPHPYRYVVNVSAAEGRFSRVYKGPEHPHTNMAKAALNMLTRTSGDELATHGILLTSVDPGWFSDQQPVPDRERSLAAGFRTPLDVVDAAARVYHPVVRGERDGDPLHGCLLKDYRTVSW